MNPAEIFLTVELKRESRDSMARYLGFTAYGEDMDSAERWIGQGHGSCAFRVADVEALRADLLEDEFDPAPMLDAAVSVWDSLGRRAFDLVVLLDRAWFDDGIHDRWPVGAGPRIHPWG